MKKLILAILLVLTLSGCVVEGEPVITVLDFDKCYYNGAEVQHKKDDIVCVTGDMSVTFTYKEYLEILTEELEGEE